MNFTNVKAICILGLLLAMLSYVNATNAQDFVTDGLVAMYTLNDADMDGKVVKDVFGKNDAKLVGNLKSVEGAADGTGEALEFEGKPENYIEIPAMARLTTCLLNAGRWKASSAAFKVSFQRGSGQQARCISNLRETKSRSTRTTVSRLP